LNTVSDVLGGRALFFDRGGDRSSDFTDALDRLTDRLDRLDGFSGRALHVDDVRADLVGGLRGLARQGLDLWRNHRETEAGIAGARGLDRGVEREQVRLFGNRRDQ